VSQAPALAGAIAADPAVRFAFTGTAEGNVSLTVGTPDADARARLAASVGVGLDDLVFMQQVHGSGVALVGADDRGRGLRDHGDGVADVDALVTAAAGIALVVLVADCVPVLLADPAHAVAAVHAGRGGVVRGVVPAALDVMAPARAGDVEVRIGPAIGGCCYEVPAELADEVAAAHPAARATTTWGSPALDLPAAVEAQLRARGVDRILRAGGCTRCGGETWFSHRRAPGTGRQAGVVVRAADGRRHA
jgi:YfiH family protein